MPILLSALAVRPVLGAMVLMHGLLLGVCACILLAAAAAHLRPVHGVATPFPLGLALSPARVPATSPLMGNIGSRPAFPRSTEQRSLL